MNASDEQMSEAVVKGLTGADGVSRCCEAPIDDAGECHDGCCDKWRCSACGNTWLTEVAQ
jgi:hypothetical protein